MLGADRLHHAAADVAARPAKIASLAQVSPPGRCIVRTLGGLFRRRVSPSAPFEDVKALARGRRQRGKSVVKPSKSRDSTRRRQLSNTPRIGLHRLVAHTLVRTHEP
jgi:hypothetical protein